MHVLRAQHWAYVDRAVTCGGWMYLYSMLKTCILAFILLGKSVGLFYISMKVQGSSRR